MKASTRRLGALLGLLLPLFSLAQTCNLDRLAPTFYRFDEDCRDLVGTPWGQAGNLKVVTLDDDMPAYVVFGGELRVRFERLDPQRFGLKGAKAVSIREERVYFDTDMHVGSHVRMFAQLGAAGMTGLAQPRPFDRTEPDVLQGFLELSATQDVGLRLGRFELPLAPNRMVGVNDAANLRRTFQGAFGFWKARGSVFTAFATKPTLQRSGSFDDGTQNETFSGIDYRTTEVAIGDTSDRLDALNLFAFRRVRATTPYVDGHGPEQRLTWGTRLNGKLAGGTWQTQWMLQTGHNGDAQIRANGLILDYSHPLPGPWSPAVSLSFGRAGGDGKAGDGKLATFDTMYANLAYATEAGYLFPGNSRDISAQLLLAPTPALVLAAGVYQIRRISSVDSVFQPPGIPLIGPSKASSNRLALLPFLKLNLRTGPGSEIMASFVDMRPQGALEAAQARHSQYAVAQWTVRF